MRVSHALRYTVLILIAVGFLPGNLSAGSLKTTGSFKSLNLHGEAAPAQTSPRYNLSSNHLRLETNWLPQPGWRFEAALDYAYLWSNPKEEFNFDDKPLNRKLDLEKTFDHGSTGESLLQIDRLNLYWRHRSLDVTVGRQAIGFGRIVIFSPLDVITPFAPDALETSVRSGVDAAQAVYNYGLDGQAGLVAVLGQNENSNSFLGTWSDNKEGVDLLLIGGSLRNRPMIGAGLAGNLGTLGLKGEFSLYRGKDTGVPTGDLHRSYALGAIEAWYRFANGISLIVQYLYNGPGVNRPEDYPRVLASAPLREGLTYLLGRHYLFFAPSYELHPLVTLQGLVITNLSDHSALVRPLLNISLADNISLQLFYAWNFGDEPSPQTSLQGSIPGSEFGMRSNQGGLFLKLFF